MEKSPAVSQPKEIPASSADNPPENGENSSQVNHSNNLSVNEIDDDTEHKLRGDAIGDTMYSHSFTVKTLLRLSEIEWNADLEEDLCFLWDMTVEKDVCAFLFSVAYPSIACDVITKYYDENRLVEIVIGIFANILCADCAKNISKEQTAIILRALDSDDPLILVQVVRFIKAMSHVDNELTFITNDILSKLSFVLANSLNQDLLLKSLDALSSIMIDNKLDTSLMKCELCSAALTAYQAIKSEREEERLSSEIQNAFTHLLNIFTSFATFVDDLQSKETVLNDIKAISSSLVAETSEVLNLYKSEESLLPVSDTFTFYIESLSYICPIFGVEYDKTLFINILGIVNLLIRNDNLDISMFSELLCYLISVTDVDRIKKDLEGFSEKEVRLIVKKFQTDFEKSDSECCREIARNYIVK